MKDILLLDKLKSLVEIDRSLSFNSQAPQVYRQRALLFQELGCDALAKYDNRISAYLEKKELEYYNQGYVPLLTQTEFEEKYQGEKHTHYYKIFFDILINDKAFSKEKLDPIYFALRSGNATLLGLFNLALRDCNDAMKYLEPFPQEYAIATVNKAMLLLLIGDYPTGWMLYEKRWETNYKSFENPMILPRPLWQGEQLNSQNRLLIKAEQGIGDNIQFVRYAIYLKQQGIDVLVWNNEHIDGFLRENLAQYGISTAKLGDSVHFSHWVRMMSLPYLCRTTLSNVPLTSKYLHSSKKYLQKWQTKLPLASQKFKVGIVWRGNSLTDSDKIRSISLSLFSQLFYLNAEFHVLQKEVNQNEEKILTNYSNVYDWHNELMSFSDTAAIIDQMDLILCVDTSVAHLAAAMGKPTWILINYKPDFRWLMVGEKSIWYESVRLFRQNLDYDWKSVIERVYIELSNKFQTNTIN